LCIASGDWSSDVCSSDLLDVVAVGETHSSPYGTFTDCVKTRDYSDLETVPGEYKWFCAGVGEIEAYDITALQSEKLLSVSVNGQPIAADGGAPAEGGAPADAGTQ
jgi:hypothetical protein